MIGMAQLHASVDAEGHDVESMVRRRSNGIETAASFPPDRDYLP
jgi:hypothetical protein